jgi:hypothetical protein
MGATQVTGRLPPEVVQRIVRQNFGRFRMCYEQALRTDPKLAGRVAVTFVIDKNGDAKSAASHETTDLPDKTAVGCVIRAFDKLSFPSPEEGTVKVVYPIMFSPGGDGEEPSAADAGAPTLAPTFKDAPCVPVHKAGEGCFGRDGCAEGLACRADTCSNEPPRAAGGVCADEDDCQPGLYCRRARGGGSVKRLGECAPRKPDGASCNSSLQCQGFCAAHACVSFCGER